MTNLAYIGKIVAISPIPAAERIELAEVVCGKGGRWRGVVPRGQFRVGGLCEVYLPDAVLPPQERFAFLEREGYRVVPRRFLGVPSEVLIMPLTVSGTVGSAIDELVGVRKHEKPLPASIGGDIAGPFPVFLRRTDEPNFQSVPALVEALRGRPWVATLKVDGTSATVYRWHGELGVCSRNYRLKPSPRSAHWQVARRYRLEDRLPEGYAVQFEVAGPGVQGNPLGLGELAGYAFDVFEIGLQRYLDHGEMQAFLAEIGFPAAPVVEAGVAFDLGADDLLRLAEGVYPSGRQREGIVVRPTKVAWVADESDLRRLSFKVLNLMYKH